MDKSFLENLHRDLLWPGDQNGKYDHIVYSWSNEELASTETFDALRNDIWWSIGTLLFVTLIISVKLRNIFLVFMALSGLLLSFPVAYFWYITIFDIHSFSLMNFTALFVMLGIGADDIFLMVDCYIHTKVYLGEDALIGERMKMAYTKAGLTMLVTSLTTAFCFYSNTFSIMKIVQEFGLFMGTTIMINYVHVMTILPSALVVNERHIIPLYNKFLVFCNARCCRRKQSTLQCLDFPTKNFNENITPTPNDSSGMIREEAVALKNETEEYEVNITDDKLTPRIDSDVEIGEKLIESSDGTIEIVEHMEIDRSPCASLGCTPIEKASELPCERKIKCNNDISETVVIDEHQTLNDSDAYTINSTIDDFKDNSCVKLSNEHVIGLLDDMQMNRLDSWFFNVYSPFIYKWRKICVFLTLTTTLIFGLCGYFAYEQATGNLVIFKEKYNLGRVMRIQNEHFNNIYDYGTEEDETWYAADSLNDIPDFQPFSPAPSISSSSVINSLSPSAMSAPSPTAPSPTVPSPTAPSPTKVVEPSACVPTQVTNSLLYSDTESLQGSAGESVEVVCVKLYTGGGTVTCQLDGTWTNSVTCTEIKNSEEVCPPLVIEHSNLNIVEKKFYAGEEFNLICDVGYIGTVTMTCMSDLSWSPSNFVCDPNSCQPAEVPHSDKAEIDSIQGKTGDQVSILCDDGYRGSDSVTCLPTGSFTSLECDNQCLFDFKNSANGNVIGITNEEIIIECNDNFNGGGETTCKQDGNFKPPVQCLLENECPTYSVAHSGILAGVVSDKVNMQCSEGYGGGGIATCTEDYSWDIIPICTAKDCTPLNVTHATQNITQGKTGETVQITCLEDFNGGGVVVCKANGVFNISGLSPCLPKVVYPKSPQITEISFSPILPVSAVVEGLYAEVDNIFDTDQDQPKVFCEISDIQGTSKEADSSSYPKFKATFNQNDLVSYGISPGDKISIRCYSEIVVNENKLKSPSILGGLIEIKAVPKKPSSIVISESKGPGSKDLTVIVNKASSSWDTKILSFQCLGNLLDINSKTTEIKEWLLFPEGSAGEMILTTTYFDSEIFVECRLLNVYGWSEWSSIFQVLEAPTCPKTCVNGGLCNSTTLACTCLIGSSGEQCDLSYCPLVESTSCGRYGKCGAHPDGPQKGNTCYCDQGYSGVDCSVEAPVFYRKTTSFIVSLVWGVKSSKTHSNLWSLGGRGDINETLQLYPVDIADPEIQTWLLNTIQEARMDLNLHVDGEKTKTWIDHVNEYANYIMIGFPIERHLFASHLKTMFDTGFLGKSFKNQIGSSGDPLIGDFTYVSLDLTVQVPYTSNNRDKSMQDAFKLWQDFIAMKNKNAPDKIGNGVVHSDAFLEVYREEKIVGTTITSWIVSNAICVVLILLFTQNFSLGFWVMVTLILMIVCLLGLMFAVYSIPFGPIEAIGVSVFVGLSSSYIIHVAHAYHDTTSITRREKIREAIFAVSSPLSASALSTIGACAFLLACRIYLFVELGILLCTNNFLALLFALIFFIALLSMIGPRQYEGDLNVHAWDFSAVYSSVRRKIQLVKDSNNK